MGEVLYKVHFQFSFVYFIPILMIVFLSVFPTIWKRLVVKYPNIPKRGTTSNPNVIKILCTFMLVFTVIVGVITFIYTINEYKSIIISYKKGNYQIAEGYVENFKPMPYSGNSDETFNINDVYFSYSDYEGNIGYNTTKSHGGVIKGDGQHLKIGYIYFNGKNTIVYIEKLD